MKLSAHEITIFLFHIAFLLAAARGLGEVARYFKQPVILGEIIAGVILGPSVLGHLYPNIYSVFMLHPASVSFSMDGITQLALVMLLLVSGLEVDLRVIFKQGKATFYTGVMGFIIPFILGFILAYIFPQYFGIGVHSDTLAFALFIGTALSITALPVVARTLMDLGIFKSEIGQTIIASAMFIDFIGWLIFSVIISMLGGTILGVGFTYTIILTLAFVAFTLTIWKKIVNRILPFIQTKLSFPGGVLNFIFISGFFAAAFTEYIGIHAIFGAFIIGIAIGDSAHLKEETREMIQQFVTNIFAPLFFISIGLRLDFIAHFDISLVAIFLAIAFITKIFGSYLGAYWGGFTKNDAWIIGFGMNSRGAMEIVLGLLALEYHVIQEDVFVALVIMALVTSMSSAPFMNIFIKRSLKLISPFDVLDIQRVFFTSAGTSTEVLHELSMYAASSAGITAHEILEKVEQREKEFPTGIANGLAIPHARLPIKRPVLALAVSKNGIDFGAMDGQPSRLIFLLLTPQNENELQLEFLASLAKLAGNAEFIKMALQLDAKDSIVTSLKNEYMIQKSYRGKTV